MRRTLQVPEKKAVPLDLGQPGRGQKKQGLRDGMGEDLEHGSRIAVDAADPQPHIDITDLRCGRKRDHSVNILLPDSGDGSEDHPHDAKYKNDLADGHRFKDRRSDDPVINFEQKNNVLEG